MFSVDRRRGIAAKAPARGVGKVQTAVLKREAGLLARKPSSQVVLDLNAAIAVESPKRRARLRRT